MTTVTVCASCRELRLFSNNSLLDLAEDNSAIVAHE